MDNLGLYTMALHFFRASPVFRVFLMFPRQIIYRSRFYSGFLHALIVCAIHYKIY
jgi:hypothetical protein